VATANDVSRIQAAKPELLRKGRWDNIYFVDVPTPEERAEILAGHLALHNSSFEASGMADAVAATANMVGAEIGYVVEASVDIALEEGRDYLIASDIVAIAADVQPVALATKSTVERLRAWAKANAKMANGEPATTAEHTSRRPEASEPIPSDRALLI
jgi:SpoVK/Ycf46/Vps4 family AAA+-type ATPase